MALAIPQFMLAGDLLNDPAACQSAQPISCGAFLNNQSNDFGTDLLDTYSCAGSSTRDDYHGKERVYVLTVDVSTRYDIRLSDVRDPELNFDLFLMRAGCDAGDCVLSSRNSDNTPERISADLTPGTYFIVVDTWDGEFGTFDLSVDCNNIPGPASCENAKALWCDELVSDNTWGEESNFDADLYNCYSGTGTFNGPDVIYSFTKASARDRIQLNLFTEASNLNIFLVSRCGDTGFSCAAVGRSFDGGKFIDEGDIGLPAGEYYVIVDGRNSATDGSFSLLLTCDNLDFSRADQLICGRQLEDQSFTGATNQSTLYTCQDVNQTPYNGPERIYYFDLPTVTDVVIDLDKTSSFGELGLFLFSSGGTPICLSSGDRTLGDSKIEASLQAGRYFIVVDSRKEAFFNLSLIGCDCPIDGTLTCEEPINSSNAGGGDDVLYTAGDCQRIPLRLDAQDVVYEFTAPATEMYEFSLTNLQTDLGLFLFEDCNNPESCIGFSNKRGDDRVSVNLERGQTIFVAVDGIARLVTSNFTLAVSCGIFPDADNDGVRDDMDNCPDMANEDQGDFDGDGIGDVCDPDDDNDGVIDTEDCDFRDASIAVSVGDTCNDGNTATVNDVITSTCECRGVVRADGDADGIADDEDNCPTNPNADQSNNDGDSMGDVCDPDDDNDGVLDGDDCFPNDATRSFSIGDSCNDGNSNTVNDRITNDCTCVGITVPSQPVQLVVESASGAVGETVCFDIVATEFQDVASASFSISIDNDLANIVSVTNVGLTTGSFTGSGCPIGGGAMTGSLSSLGGFVVWSADANGSLSLGAITPIVEVCAEILTDTLDKATVSISSECRTAEFFDSNAEEIEIETSNGQLCRTSNSSTATTDMNIAGRVLSVSSVGLKDISVDLSGDMEMSVLSNADGVYSLDVPVGGDYLLAPSSTDDVMQNVTVMDVLLFRRHFIFQKTFTSPFQYVAADIDGNGRLSIRDEQLLKHMVLGLNTFDIPIWRFVKADHNFPVVPDYTIGGGIFEYPTSVNINDLTDHMTQDFVGVRVGDLDIDNLISANRSLQNRNIYSHDVNYKKGDRVSLPLHMDESLLLSGLSIEINFDNDKLSFDKLSTKLDGDIEDMLITRYVEGGKILVQWIGDESAYIESRADLLTLEFVASGNGVLSESIMLDDQYRPSEIINDELDVSKLDLIFEQQFAASALSISPNPIKDFSIVSYINASSETLSGDLNLFDMSGRQLMNKSIKLIPGENNIEIRKEELGNHQGMVIVEVSTSVEVQRTTAVFID